MAHQPGIKGFHTSQATGIRGLSGLQNPSQLHKGFRLLESTGIKEEEEEEEANEHLDASDSSLLFKKKKVPRSEIYGKVDYGKSGRKPGCAFYSRTPTLGSSHRSLSGASKSVSEDTEVGRKRESVFILGGGLFCLGVTYWFSMR